MFVSRELQSLLADQLTVQEALDLLFAQDGDDGPISDTIYIAPPDPAMNSDEDSGDDDGGGEVDNLTTRQLTAEAEIRYHDARDEVFEDTVGGISTSEASDTIVIDNNFSFDGIPSSIPKTWYSGSIENNLPRFPHFDHNKYKNFTLVELFDLFMDDDIFEMFTVESNRYAVFKECDHPSITKEEIKCFIAILILSGYNSVSNRRLYWDSFGDSKNELIVQSMRRNRFEQILRFFHCIDNTKIDQKNKMWKLQPLIDKVKQNCKKHFVPQQHLSYDESMVKYYGNHSCKQFIKGKPIRFGFKVWCLCTINGYLIDFDVYQGKNALGNENYQQLFGKSTAPFVQMLESFPLDIRKLPYQFYFDNLFTSLNLLSFLRENGYGGTGTIKQSRLSKGCPLPDKKFFDKKNRGYYESAISKEDGVLLVKWKDNATVTVASNSYGVEPLGNARRYSKTDKCLLNVSRPHLVGEYNRYMGGVDRLDENVAMHRIHIRNKKWYWALLTWLIDVSIHNAWLLARHSGKKLSQLDFRREIVKVYLTRYGSPPKGTGRPPTCVTGSRIPIDVRYDGIKHWIQKIEKKRRCAGEGCSTKTSAVRTQCKKCNVGLCIDCFESFHTPK